MAKVYEALTNNNIDYSYLNSQNDVDKMKRYNDGVLQEMLGHWNGSIAFCALNPGGYDNSPYANYYKTIHIHVYREGGKYFTRIYSEFIENCYNVRVEIQGNYNILIAGIEPYYKSTFSILFINKKSSYENSHIDWSNSEFDGRTAIDGDGINRYNGIGALVKNFNKNVTEEEIQKHLNLNSGANVFVSAGNGSEAGQTISKRKKPVLRYVAVIIGILLLINLLSGLFSEKDGSARKEIGMSRDEITAAETISELLSDFSHISEAIEKEEVENISQISLMLEQIDRRLDAVSAIEYQEEWEIAAYYGQISADLEELHEFINSNKDFVRDAVPASNEDTGTNEIMTRLMSLPIYGDHENSSQTGSESDAMIYMVEKLFLSEIRIYLTELKAHIDPILRIELPGKYTEIIS
jgi:hypothetical protein